MWRSKVYLTMITVVYMCPVLDGESYVGTQSVSDDDSGLCTRACVEQGKRCVEQIFFFLVTCTCIKWCKESYVKHFFLMMMTVVYVHISSSRK